MKHKKGAEGRARFSCRAMQAAAMFGAEIGRGSWVLGLGAKKKHRTAPDVLRSSAAVTVVVGPSGSGKTTLLREVLTQSRGERGGGMGKQTEAVWVEDVLLDAARAASESRSTALAVAPGDARLVDCVGGNVEEAVECLARAGLAEARVMLRRPSELSAGEAYRFRLALMMARAESLARTGRWAVMVIDEFGGNLDTATARSAAALLRRFVDRTRGVRAVIATPRDDLMQLLRPERVIEVDAWHRARERSAACGLRRAGESASDSSSKSGRSRLLPGIVIRRGALADYRALAGFHYRGGTPATVVRVLTARAKGERDAVGVLVVSMPVLCGPWRRLAWPGVFDGGSRRAQARRLNDRVRGVRCISRVIVDPRFRGSGIATRLVKAYLKRPMTTCTEALAAMGRASSFFDAAGMTRYEMPPSARHARLMDLFEQFGIEAWDLADAAAATARAKRRIGARLLGRELRVWAGAMDRGNRRYRSVDDLMRLAAKRVASTPVAFAAGGRGMRG